MTIKDQVHQTLGILAGLYDSIRAPIDEIVDDFRHLPYDRIAVAFVIFAVLFALRRPIRHLMFAVFGKLFGLGQQDFRDHLGQSLRGPVEMLAIVVGTFLAFEVLKAGEDTTAAAFSDHIVQTLLIAAVYWGLMATIDPLTAHLLPRASRLTASGADWARKALKCVVVFFAIVAILQEWGIRIGPLLAGMGIAGAAVALGAQQLFKNLISGVLILLERRFQYGDWVQVEGKVEGTVEVIGFRSTRIRQFNDAVVQVPNSDLADNAVINYTQMRHRRIFWLVGVPYTTSVEQLRAIRDGIEQYIHGSADFVPGTKVSTFVRIDAFAQSSITIMVYCFTQTTDWGDWLKIKEELAYKIMDIVSGAGSSFAFPSTSLYVESLPHRDRPDLFLPPEKGKPRIEPAPDDPAAAPPPHRPAGTGARRPR